MDRTQHGPAIYLEQVMHFQFGFGVNGIQTLWPHIQCNTLRRKSSRCPKAKGRGALERRRLFPYLDSFPSRFLVK